MENNTSSSLEVSHSTFSKKIFIPLTFVFFLVVFLVIGWAYFFQRNQGVPQGNNAQNPYPVESKSTEIFTTESTNIDHIAPIMRTYRNDKYGFNIDFPSTLNIESIVDYDIQADTLEYRRKCTSGELDGCGGGPQPLYQVRFLNNSQDIVFTVNMYQFDMSEYIGGQVEKNFTYWVSGMNQNPEEENIISGIQESLTFIPTQKSLQCLWTPAYLSTEVDSIPNAIQSHGVYFDQKTQLCQTTSVYSTENIAIPFTDVQSCMIACHEY